MHPIISSLKPAPLMLLIALSWFGAGCAELDFSDDFGLACPTILKTSVLVSVEGAGGDTYIVEEKWFGEPWNECDAFAGQFACSHERVGLRATADDGRQAMVVFDVLGDDCGPLMPVQEVTLNLGAKP